MNSSRRNLLCCLLVTQIVFSFSLCAYADSYKKHLKKQDYFYAKDNFQNNYHNNQYFSGHTSQTAYHGNNPHAGKVDSDGILSPGEIPNPLINYYRPQTNGYRPPYGSYGKPNYQYKRPCDSNGRPIDNYNRPPKYWWYRDR